MQATGPARSLHFLHEQNAGLWVEDGLVLFRADQRITAIVGIDWPQPRLNLLYAEEVRERQAWSGAPPTKASLRREAAGTPLVRVVPHDKLAFTWSAYDLDDGIWELVSPAPQPDERLERGYHLREVSTNFRVESGGIDRLFFHKGDAETLAVADLRAQLAARYTTAQKGATV